MGRASEDFLGELHGLVARRIADLMNSDDPREVIRGIDLGLKMLKDNSITAQIDASTPLSDIQNLMPKAEELEKLMTMTPD